MNYENESLEVINDIENLIQDVNLVGVSDLYFKITESIKVNLLKFFKFVRFVLFWFEFTFNFCFINE